jgi:peptidoglycan/LPS O-acetylase OafA/YrhL
MDVHGGLDKHQVKATSSYRPDIDGLRAFAVLSVIVFHGFPTWLPGGFVGVDVFFVISGYLISGHIFDSLEQGRFSLLGFYNKRIRRIFPALVTVLAACLVFGWFALLVDEYMMLGLHAASGAGFVSNLVLWTESGYFDTLAITKPLLHLWSLGIEEQFYIVWPLMAWALWALRVNLGVAVMLLAAASFALNTTYFQLDQAAAFYSPLTRFWELLAGTGLAIYERNRAAPLRPAVASAAWAGSRPVH